MTFASPVAVTRGDDLRRLVLRAERPLLGHQQRLFADRPSTTRRCTRSANARSAATASTPTARRARSRAARIRRQLLGRRHVRRSRRRRPGDGVDRRDRGGRPASADVTWTAPAERRPGDLVQGHAVHRLDGPDADDGHRHAAGDEHDGHRADQRHDLHVHGPGPERATAPGPASAQSNPVTPSAPAAPVGADGRDRAAGDDVGARELDPAQQRRRQRDHRLHRHAVHRRRRRRRRPGAARRRRARR